MTISEAAEHLGVPQAQLLRWAGWRLEGYDYGPDFVGHPYSPGSLSYDPAEIDDWQSRSLERRREAFLL